MALSPNSASVAPFQSDSTEELLWHCYASLAIHNSEQHWKVPPPHIEAAMKVISEAFWIEFTTTFSETEAAE